MDSDNIKSAVVEVLKAVQKSSGKPYVDLVPDDEPIKKLDGFDSLTGIEATIMLEERLACEIDRNSAFVSEDGRRAMTLAEICEYLEKHASSKMQAIA